MRKKLLTGIKIREEMERLEADRKKITEEADEKLEMETVLHLSRHNAGNLKTTASATESKTSKSLLNNFIDKGRLQKTLMAKSNSVEKWGVRIFS